MSVFYDPPSNFHPDECDGPGSCVHCDRMFVEDYPNGARHDPKDCELCAVAPIPRRTLLDCLKRQYVKGQITLEDLEWNATKLLVFGIADHPVSR